MLRRMLLATTLAVTCAASPAAFAQAPDVSTKLEAVIRAHAPAGSHVGVSVLNLATGQPVYEHAADKLFTPASVQKLVTASVALSLLGSQRRFMTKLAADGMVEAGKLRGHLYLRGEGDPVLEAADLETLAAALRSQGVREVQGDLVVDANYFAPEGRGAAGWAWDDMAWDYGAPVSALGLHRNAVDLTAAPAGSVNTPVNFALTPASSYVQVTNRATTGAPGSPNTLAVKILPAGAYERWVLTGTLAVGAPQETLTRAVADPARFAGVTLKEALERRGVTVSGAVRPGATPAAARTIAAHQSPPLADLVREMNKSSDNLIAETLLLHVGARAKGAPGTWQKGLEGLEAFLGKAGWQAGTYRLADGSGLSRYNAVTPAQVSRLLAHMPSDRLAYPALLISLPVAGFDGTLADRLSGDRTRGRLRGKTGTMSSVSGLAGYVQTPSGEWLALTVLVNGFVGTAGPSRQLQDKLIEALAQE